MSLTFQNVWYRWHVFLCFSPQLPALWEAVFLKAAATNPWGYSAVFLGLSELSNKDF